MNIHEYQAKSLFRQYGIPVGDFAIISSIEDLQAILNDLRLQQAVLKIQVHAGGRGKAGGVKIARSKQEIFNFADEMLGMRMVNQQTGPLGIIASKLLISPLVEIKKEYYMGAVIDRQSAQSKLIISPEGGMDIEEIAARSQDRILTIPITENGVVREYNLLRMCKFMGWSGQLEKQGRSIAMALAKMFVNTDASLIEINPLVETLEGELLALDAKFSVDDNALFRQPELAAFYDPTQLTPEEREAKKYDLAYVALNGQIGCMVNGAGLAMATMDIIQLYGGMPANFLDVGGGASQDKVAAGFKIVLSDAKVRSILVNIFGGIMNCEILSAGILAAVKEVGVKVPLIVRMEGTNVEHGRKLLVESGLNIMISRTMAEAAQQAVAAAKS